MHRYPPNRRLFLSMAAAVTSAVLLIGCAASGHKIDHPGSGEAALLARAQAYWDAIKAGDRVTAWDYTAHSQNPHATLQDYLKGGGVVYNSVEIKGVRSMTGDTAVLDVGINYSVPILRMRNQDREQADHWRLIEGNWYHDPPRSLLMPTGHE